MRSVKVFHIHLIHYFYSPMKKWYIKYPLYLIAILVVLVGGFALFIQLRGIPSYPTQKIDLKVEVTPARVQRGRKLVSILCAECHFDQKTNRLTGKRMIDMPETFGKAYSRNITQDPVYGIGGWTDGDIAFLLRTGIKKNGKYAPPWMVKLPNMADEDLYSIIAFLRSNDTLVQAAQVKDRESEPSWFAKFLCFVAFKPFPYPDHAITAPDTSNHVAYGKYLATGAVQCFGCHSADFSKLDELHPERSGGFMGGGTKTLDASGRNIFTANITMDKETGIGNWTEDQFVHAVRQGFNPDNRVLRYPMEPFPNLTDWEARDIYAYLQTVPVIHNQVDRTLGEMNVAGAGDGSRIYHKYGCYSCHGETGVGVCDLRGADRKYPADSSLVAWIRDPSKTVPDSKMPTWNGIIQEDEYPVLCQYVRELGRKATDVASAK